MLPEKDLSDDIQKPFHSNGYAQVASGNNLGSSGNISFTQRQAIDKSRQIINEYQRSNLGRLQNALRSKAIETNPKIELVPPKLDSKQRFNSSSTSGVSISPKSQNYNPYS